MADSSAYVDFKRGSKQRGRKNLMDIILTAFVS